MKLKNLGRRTAVVAAAIVGIWASGIAFAAGTQTATWNGSRALTATAPAVTARSGTPDLYPGAAAGDVHFSVSNPNPYPVRFTSASFGSVVSSDPTGCPASNLTTTAPATGLAINVPANTTAPGVDASFADVVSMAADAPNGCQGVTFTIGVTLSGVQQ